MCVSILVTLFYILCDIQQCLKFTLRQNILICINFMSGAFWIQVDFKGRFWSIIHGFKWWFMLVIQIEENLFMSGNIYGKNRDLLQDYEAELSEPLTTFGGLEFYWWSLNGLFNRDLIGVWISHEKDDPNRISIQSHWIIFYQHASFLISYRIVYNSCTHNVFMDEESKIQIKHNLLGVMKIDL